MTYVTICTSGQYDFVNQGHSCSSVPSVGTLSKQAAMGPRASNDLLVLSYIAIAKKADRTAYDVRYRIAVELNRRICVWNSHGHVITLPIRGGNFGGSVFSRRPHPLICHTHDSLNFTATWGPFSIRPPHRSGSSWVVCTGPDCHYTIICVSVRLSVLQQVSEKVNSKCRPRNMAVYNFQPQYTDVTDHERRERHNAQRHRRTDERTNNSRLSCKKPIIYT